MLYGTVHTLVSFATSLNTAFQCVGHVYVIVGIGGGSVMIHLLAKSAFSAMTSAQSQVGIVVALVAASHAISPGKMVKWR